MELGWQTNRHLLMMMAIMGLGLFSKLKPYHLIILIGCLSIGIQSTLNEDASLTLTPDHSTTTINIMDNYTLTINTDHQEPSILIKGIVPTQAYYPTTVVWDWKFLVCILHNIRQLANDHLQKLEYNKQKKFISSANTSSYEYYVHPHKLAFQHCQMVCTSLDAQLLYNILQVQESGALLNLGESFMWVQTTQENRLKPDGTWDSQYAYVLYFNTNYRIWPVPEYQEPLSLLPCILYKGGNIVIAPGYSYSWWRPQQGYHTHTPYRLRVAANNGRLCQVIVPTDPYTIEDNIDDQQCVCAKRKTTYLFAKNDLVAQTIHDDLQKGILNSSHIEDWRFKTSNTPANSISTLEYPLKFEDKLIPAFPRYNKEDSLFYRNNYLDHEIITDLRLNKHKATSLKIASMGKKIGGFLAKNPRLWVTLGKQMHKLVMGSKRSLAVPSSSLMGNAVDFIKKLNTDHPQYNFSRQGDVITVALDGKRKYKLMDPDQFKQLNASNSAKSNEEGLLEATKTLKLVNTFLEKIFPSIFDKNQISHQDLTNKGINIDLEGTAYQFRHKYPSYQSVRTYFPIKIHQPSHVYQFLTLPFRFIPTGGVFIRKTAPPPLLMEPGQTIRDQVLTPCTMNFLQNMESTQCSNEEIHLNDLTELFAHEQYSIYVAKAIGKSTVNCQEHLKWFELVDEINVFLLPASCTFSTLGDYALHIKQKKSTNPFGIKFRLIITYNINEMVHYDHIMIISLAIIFFILCCIIGVMIALWFKTKQYVVSTSEQISDHREDSSPHREEPKEPTYQNVPTMKTRRARRKSIVPPSQMTVFQSSSNEGDEDYLAHINQYFDNIRQARVTMPPPLPTTSTFTTFQEARKQQIHWAFPNSTISATQPSVSLENTPLQHSENVVTE